MTTKKKPAYKPQYTATAKIVGKTYVGKGTDVASAVSNLKGFGNVKGKIILTIEHGDYKKERVLMPNVAFRLFSGSPFSKQVALKQLSSLFD